MEQKIEYVERLKKQRREGKKEKAEKKNENEKTKVEEDQGESYVNLSFSSQDGQISPSLFLCMCFCRLPILLAPYKTQTYTTTLVNNAYL